MGETFHRLMYGCFFPAVLGTIFVLYMQYEIFAGFSWSPRHCLFIIYLIHWSREYVAFTRAGMEGRYTWKTFLADLAQIFIIFGTLLTIPPGIDKSINDYSVFFVLMSIMFAILAIDDYFYDIWDELSYVDLSMVCVSFLFASLSWFGYFGNDVEMWVYIYLALTAVVASLFNVLPMLGFFPQRQIYCGSAS